ncbi:MAG: hypothetical protein HFH87_11380 [Lachnospiraceae bacterium]|nr:hypothetical protein [Lachnospiraceae bacterium]
MEKTIVLSVPYLHLQALWKAEIIAIFLISIKDREVRMWCAVHVRDGDEARAEALVKGILSGELEARCFHLTRSRRKKYRGQWQTVREKLLPGYLFIDTDKPEAVYRELEKTSGPQLLFSSAAFVTALETNETALMERLADESGEIAVSKVKVEEDGSVKFLSGPLLQVESMVRKVNLHQRVAEIETDFLGEKRVLYLGIEIEK